MAIPYVRMEIPTDSMSFLRGFRRPAIFGMSLANTVATIVALTAACSTWLEAESYVQHRSQIPNAMLRFDGALSHVEGDVLHLIPARKEHSLCFVSQFKADSPHRLLHRLVAFSKNMLSLLQGLSSND